jgi:hypothetical protein
MPMSPSPPKGFRLYPYNRTIASCGSNNQERPTPHGSSITTR